MEKLKKDLGYLAFMAEQFGIPPTEDVRRFAVVLALHNLSGEDLVRILESPELQTEFFALVGEWLEEDVAPLRGSGVQGMC